MPQRRSAEFWQRIRELIERGLSLKQASKQFGVSFSHLRERAALEGWRLAAANGRGRPRTLSYPSEARRLEIAREQAQYDALQAELRRESEVVQIDFERAELLSRKVMASRSQKLKEMLSELLLRMGEEMLSGSEVRLRDKAAAALAINSIGKSLFGLPRHAHLHQLERVSSHTLTSAANLAPISPSTVALPRPGE